MNEPRVLIIEDGDEYLDGLSRFVPGPTYIQAQHGEEAIAVLSSRPVDVIYLDMRFDRSAQEHLLGDLAGAIRRHNGSHSRGLHYLATHQGLFILEAIRSAGFQTPVLLAYDFSHEQARFARLADRYPNLSWIPDAISPEEVRARLKRLLRHA